MFDPNISIELNSTGAVVHYDAVRDSSSGMIGCNVIELSDREILDIANTIDVIKERNFGRLKKKIHDKIEDFYNNQTTDIISGMDLQVMIQSICLDDFYPGRKMDKRYIHICVTTKDGSMDRYDIDLLGTYMETIVLLDDIADKYMKLCIDPLRTLGSPDHIYLKEMGD